jgi:hypothetical protein
MAWTYFTALLDGTRPITKNERDELYSQLATKLLCPPRFSLPSSYMTPLKASGLLTDRAALLDSLLSSTILGRLDVIIDGATAAFSNCATAKTAALATAGLTAGNLTTLLAGAVDHYKLWNFYRSWIEGLTPNPPPNPTLVARTASASKTKCGFSEFVVSSPPKIYLTRTSRGTVSLIYEINACNGEYYVITQASSLTSGSKDYNRATCAVTDTHSGTYSDSSPGSASCAAYSSSTGISGDTDLGGDGTPVLTSTTYTTPTLGVGGATRYGLSGAGCAGAAGCSAYDNGAAIYSRFYRTGSQVSTLSNEFTTALLVSDTLAAIPAFSGSYSAGAATALYDLTTDQLTASLRSLQYKFTLPTLTGYVSYRIEWQEVFTPAVGGPTSVAKSYTWDGVATETPAYTIPAPSTKGSTVVTITGITAGC